MTREEAERLVETGEVYPGMPYRGEYADGAYAFIEALDTAGAFDCITKAQAEELYQEGRLHDSPFEQAWSEITKGNPK